jgi:hypothetical protein
MKHQRTVIVILLSGLLLAGCASTKLSDQQTDFTGRLPRPGQIIIYDFVTSPEGVSPDSALGTKRLPPANPQTPEQIALDRQLGMQIAEQLAQEIRAMGLPGVSHAQARPAQLNDLLIRGHLLTVDQGSELKRVALGFGAGASDLRTLIEGYQMTANGPRKLGQGDIDAGGGKTPGAALGVATLLVTHNPIGLVVSTGVKAYGEVSGSATIEGRAKATAKEIADQLKIRFEQQGWMQK